MTFPKEQIYCILDYETYSEADLKKAGAFEYSVHPTTEILCAAWRIGTREGLATAKTEAWAPTDDSYGNLGTLFQALMNPSVILLAHNAYFEQVITRNVFATKYMYSKKKELQSIPSARWVCTASLAAALALPRNLAGAAEALKLPVQKDMEGNRLIMKWCKPKKPTLKNPSTRCDDAAEFKRIIEYCKTDIGAEVGVFLATPSLTAKERAVWILDQKINLRGFLVDRPLVEKILRMIEIETTELNRKTTDLTFGMPKSANQRAGILAWLEDEGVYLPDLRRKTVEDALQSGEVQGRVKQMLELRLATSKTSTAKYQAFEMRSRHDSRLRDNLVYHTASTGRWGGAGVQPQNFPRGTIKDSVLACSVLADEDLEFVRACYGDPMSAFSSCLRGMIVTPQGKTLDVADYAAIEARVLFWVAKHEAGLQAFRDGRDLYREQATSIFGVTMEQVNSYQRFVGKSVILGAGYSMGWEKFMDSCKQQGQVVSEDLAKAAIAAYRTVHKPVVNLWNSIERAAVTATQNPGKKYTINRTAWFMHRDFLFCELPSGRRLAYHRPRVAFEQTPWGDRRPVLYHWGVAPLSRKWVEAKTYGGRLTENVVQAIARDLMAEAMLRIEAKGPWEIVLSVHDELVAERNLGSSATNDDFCKLMAALPDWAEGLPVKVEGWAGTRYRK